MKDGQRSFLQHIETLFDAGAIGEQTDRQLLELFTGRDRTAAELAFTVLVKRHGPMIFRACRAILHDPHAAEDAFQATFLVLARKAPGLWVRGSLGPWLLSVARRVACCARTDASRRRAHERTAAELRGASHGGSRRGMIAMPSSTRNWGACRRSTARRCCSATWRG